MKLTSSIINKVMSSYISLVDLPKDAVSKFMEIYKKHYEVDLNFEEAKKIACRLMRMLMVVSQPILSK